MKLTIFLSFLTILGLCFSFKGSKKPLVLCLACPGICPKTTTPKHMRELDTDKCRAEDPDSQELKDMAQCQASDDDIKDIAKWRDYSTGNYPDYDTRAYSDEIPSWHYDNESQWHTITKKSGDTSPSIQFYIISLSGDDNTTTTSTTTTTTTRSTSLDPPPPNTTTTSTTTHSPPPTTVAPSYICRLCYEQCGY